MAYDICNEVKVGSRVNLWDDNGIQIRRLQLHSSIISDVFTRRYVFSNLFIPLPSSHLEQGHSRQH